MTARPQPAVTTRGDAATARRVAAPYILVRKTKTAGWQVVHVYTSGRSGVLRRNLTFVDAMTVGTAASKVNECPLEIES